MAAPSVRKSTAEPVSLVGMDKLSSEIFSILESNFLFGTTSPPVASSSPAPAFFRGTPSRDSSASSSCGGMVRVLSVDAAGATEGLLAAASLARLETALRLRTGDASTRIADFFDMAAGSGVGGVLVALLFSAGPSGRPLLTAPEALRFLSKHHAEITGTGGRKGGFFRALFKGRSSKAGAGGSAKVFKAVFGDLTLRDTLKPVLIPCYDLGTGAPFVFSRADAVEMDGAYDFRMWEVCAATMGMAAAAKVVSVDGRTVISAAAIDGGVAMGNPAAAAVTHVLNNKMEFPLARGVQDLVLLSLGNGEAGSAGWRPGSATPGPARIARIAGDGVSDMIDQAVAMSFGATRSSNYIRIQGRDPNPRTSSSSSSTSPADLLSTAEEMLLQRNIESVLFRGKKLSEQTNAEKLEWAAGELIKEAERRKRSPVPVVVVATPKRGAGRRNSTSSTSSSLMSSSPSASSLSSSP